MERLPVTSSNIISVGYEPAEMVLEIEFHSGIYRYFSVPESVHSGLMSASSHGRYFAHTIKDRYSFSKVA
ncbi:KTSC domain-containing protein [Streptomyces sp. AM6-12]|uniref:KTSC domain-containing protein n=1 Tax=Streptomyces sp. AM6-12 TaxID=3345149 RepID=UPI0037923B86